MRYTKLFVVVQMIGVSQVLLINEPDRTKAMAIWASIKDLRPTVAALEDFDNPIVRNSASPKAQILSGNHSVETMKICALETAKTFAEAGNNDVEKNEKTAWPFYTRVNVVVYFGLNAQQAMVVRVPHFFCFVRPLAEFLAH